MIGDDDHAQPNPGGVEKCGVTINNAGPGVASFSFTSASQSLSPTTLPAGGSSSVPEFNFVVSTDSQMIDPTNGCRIQVCDGTFTVPVGAPNVANANLGSGLSIELQIIDYAGGRHVEDDVVLNVP